MMSDPTARAPAESSGRDGSAGSSGQRRREHQPARPDGDHGSGDEATRSSAGPSLHTHEFKSDETNIADQIADQITNYQTFIGSVAGDELLRYRSLSHDDFRTLGLPGILDEIGRVLSHPDDEQDIWSTLRENRIAILTGKPELGKGMIAKASAVALCQEHGLTGVLDCKTALDRRVDVDWSALASSKYFHNKVLIFKDAFNSKNEDLLRFASRTDDIQFRHHRQQLQGNQIFVLLTSDSEHAPKDMARAIRQLRVDVRGPDGNARLCYFEEEARQCIARAVSGDERSELLASLERWLTEHARTVVSDIDTIPRLTRFAEGYLVAMIRGETSLEDAVQHFDNADRWLLEEKGDDLELLAYVTSLTLCSVSPSFEAVPWYQFDRLRRLIAGQFRAELERAGQPREARELCHEARLLREIGAEVVDTDSGRGVMIRFKEPDRAERFWKCLLGSGRGLLGTIVPPLQKLARSERGPLSDLIMRALGRIGQLDPEAITLPLLSHAGESGSTERWSSLGALMQGVLASNGPGSYRRVCLSHYRQALGARDTDHASTAILSLIRVGETDLHLAMSQLIVVVDDWLLPILKKLTRQRSGLRMLAAELRSPQNPSELGLDNSWMAALVELFPPETEGEILQCTLAVIFGLSCNQGPLAVISELRRWMAPGQERRAAFIGFVFLIPGGVFDFIECASLELPGRHDHPEEWSPVVHSAAHTADGLEQLTAFLVKLYTHLDVFSKSLRRLLRERWLMLLKAWARQAATGTLHRDLVIDIWIQLLDAPDPEIQDRLWDMLRYDKYFSNSRSAMSKIAAEIRSRST